MNEERYCLNAPDVVSENVDGEVVVVDLGKGIYYSLEGSASPIWELLVAGHTVDEATAVLEPVLDAPAERLRRAVAELLEEVKGEGLVSPRPQDLPAPQTPEGLVTGTAFVAPRLARFTDMQDLLALDPVHDADEQQGWPHRKAGV